MMKVGFQRSATMHEGRDTILGQNHIRRSWQILAVQAEAQSLRMQVRANLNFGPFIAPLDAGHQRESSALGVHAFTLRVRDAAIGARLMRSPKDWAIPDHKARIAMSV